MKGRELSNVGCWGLTGSEGGFLGEQGRSQKRMRRSKGQEEMEQGIDEIGGCQNLLLLPLYHSLFYHLKKLLYHLYHTILQYLRHSKFLFFLFYSLK